MINALHLLWIVPLAVVVGYSICVGVVISKDVEEFEGRDDV